MVRRLENYCSIITIARQSSSIHANVYHANIMGSNEGTLNFSVWFSVKRSERIFGLNDDTTKAR